MSNPNGTTPASTNELAANLQTDDARDPLMEVRDLKMHFPISAGLVSRTVGYVKAADEVSFQIFPGETLGLVGESGCGKTTVGRCLIRAYEPTGGEIRYRTPAGDVVDLAQLSRSELQPYRPQIRMIFQDPYSSLNPRMTVFEVDQRSAAREQADATAPNARARRRPAQPRWPAAGVHAALSPRL